MLLSSIATTTWALAT